MFDKVIGISKPSERRLMIELSVMRGSYERREIEEVFWITADQNPVDTMTKIDSKSFHILFKIMEKNKIDVREECWVDRNASPPK